MPIFATDLPIVLASGSPRRRELLSWLGLDFRICPAPGESAPQPGEAPADYAARAALEKALAVLNLPELADLALAPLILAADTIVTLKGKIYGKPVSHEQALQFLVELSGNTHEVITGCCLLLPKSAYGPEQTGSGEPAAYAAATPGRALSAGYRAVRFAPRSLVSMWNCPEAALRAYADSDEPMDKAGAYAVQGRGGFLIRSIEGSWSNVVGLPMAELTEILLEQGAIHAAAA